MAVSWPFDSTLTQDSDGNPVYSRTYSSDVIAKILAKYFRNGVYPDPSTGFKVQQNGGMTVGVKPGAANINGRQVYEDSNRVLTIQAANSGLDRIDTIVLRLNLNTNALNIDLYVLNGTAAATPSAPNLTRNASIWELGLANVFVAKGTTSISQASITDTRLNSERCGIVASIMGDIDTSEFYDQIQSDLAEFKATEQTGFNAWFDSIQTQLSGDVAGNLLNLINGKQPTINSSNAASVRMALGLGSGATKNIQAGSFTVTVAAGNYVDTTVPFSPAFPAAPAMSGNIGNASAASYTRIGISPSAASAVVRVYNEASAEKTLTVLWIAVSR